VAQVARKHPRFRSTLIGEEAAREYAHINLGIAVGKLDGQLTTAVIRCADTLDFESFMRNARERIAAARDGRDQADDTVQLHLTYMGNYGVTDAIPVVVAPAVGVIFIGATYLDGTVTRANLTLTFDHRLIQGIEAALFMQSLVEACEGLSVAETVHDLDEGAGIV
jgi:pyruvate dehydrogenase E2 component (dihydrolipoamide acetyltransferase)